MPSLYKQYCYQTEAEIAASIQSEVFVPGIGTITSVTDSNGSITINFLDSSFNPQSYSYVPPTCTQIGFDNSYTGISVTDSINLSWSVTLVFIIAFSITVLKRGL